MEEDDGEDKTEVCTTDLEISTNGKSIWLVIERHYNQVEVSDNDKCVLTRLITLISLPTEHQQ